MYNIKILQRIQNSYKFLINNKTKEIDLNKMNK